MTCVISNHPSLTLIILFNETPKLKAVDFLKVISLSILRLLLLSKETPEQITQLLKALVHRGITLAAETLWFVTMQYLF